MTKADNDHSTTQLVSKWGQGVLDSGFVLVPTLLFRHQKELGLDSNEVVVLMNLLASWWAPETNPFPRTSTIARRMNVTTRTVQRCLSRLEKKELIGRIRDRVGTKEAPRVRTSYDMSGVVAAIKTLRAVGVVPGMDARKEKARPMMYQTGSGEWRELTPNPGILGLGDQALRK